MSIRVVLADDHTLVRAGIRTLLREFPDIQVVGEASDGPALLELVATQGPDVALVDIGMPGMSGLEVVRRLSTKTPSVRAVILSMHKGEEYVVEALRAGAAGYLLKDSAVGELEIALHAVMRGETYLSPAICRAVMNDSIGNSSQERGWALTNRQREVLQLVVDGYTNKEIAQRLGVSHRTVEVHRMQIMRRLNVNNVPALVRLAVRLGLVSRN